MPRRTENIPLWPQCVLVSQDDAPTLTLTHDVSFCLSLITPSLPMWQLPISNNLSLWTTVLDHWRSPGHAASKCATLEYWLFWAKGTWKSTRAERGFLRTRYRYPPKYISPKRNCHHRSLPTSVNPREDELLPQERRLKVLTIPRHTLSKTILSPIYSCKGPFIFP